MPSSVSLLFLFSGSMQIPAMSLKWGEQACNSLFCERDPLGFYGRGIDSLPGKQEHLCQQERMLHVCVLFLAG